MIIVCSASANRSHRHASAEPGGRLVADLAQRALAARDGAAARFAELRIERREMPQQRRRFVPMTRAGGDRKRMATGVSRADRGGAGRQRRQPDVPGHRTRPGVDVQVIAAGPVAHHRGSPLAERQRDLVVVPCRQRARRHAAAMVQLREIVRRPDAGLRVEGRTERHVEQVPSGRDQQLVERAEQPRVAPGEHEAVQPGPGEELRDLDQLGPGLGHTAADGRSAPRTRRVPTGARTDRGDSATGGRRGCAAPAGAAGSRATTPPPAAAGPRRRPEAARRRAARAIAPATARISCGWTAGRDRRRRTRTPA